MLLVAPELQMNSHVRTRLIVRTLHFATFDCTSLVELADDIQFTPSLDLTWKFVLLITSTLLNDIRYLLHDSPQRSAF